MQWDEWAQWALLGVAIAGLVVLVVLALRIFQLLKAFGGVVSTGSATLADATSVLEAAQAGTGSAAFGRAPSSAAYTPKSIPTREADI